MSEKLIRNRQLCLDHAQEVLDAAKRVGVGDFPFIAYHLSLVALEEVGKASMIAAQLATGNKIENTWIDKSLEDHVRKLQWALWSPTKSIDPIEFKNAREYARKAHALRLDSLYVNAKAEVDDTPARELVSLEEAKQAFDMAVTRLDYERSRGTPDPEAHDTDDLLNWFLTTVDDPAQSRQLFSKSFIDRYHELGKDARDWITWAREEVLRREAEAQAFLDAELAKPSVSVDHAKPKWRTKITVYTPSHSLRKKVLNRWNSKMGSAQLLWEKKDQFTLQLTFRDNAQLSELASRSIHLSKLVVACLNIGSTGYFWFERAGFERQMFSDVRDLENKKRLKFDPQEGFWGDERAGALKDEHINYAIHCMMTFAPLAEADAAPIFRPYYDGLALMAKSDSFYSFESMARKAFIASLGAAFARYEGWDGKDESFSSCYNAAFTPIMAEQEHRDQMLRVLTGEGDPNESPLANLRSAKQMADLYLILVGQHNWSKILEQNEGTELRTK
ncbi:MAG: AbiV family abortive infection protein [Rhodobacteraceae bacterium]|nr:AbiV family abortive infection protein [Paracoccaceae bacterium]